MSSSSHIAAIANHESLDSQAVLSETVWLAGDQHAVAQWWRAAQTEA